MTQYNSLNVQLSNSQLDIFKSAIKNENKVVLRLSSNMVDDNEANFPHKLLLTNKQVSNLRKLLQITYQLISNYQKLNYLRRYNQEDFWIDYLVHY